MRKIKIIEHISLDGVIHAPGSPNEDGDYPYGGWTVPYRDPVGGKTILAAHAGGFDLLLGWRTYDFFAGFWPKAPSNPLADSLNAATKYVATHRPDSLGWGPFHPMLGVSEAIGSQANSCCKFMDAAVYFYLAVWAPNGIRRSYG